MQSKFKNQCLFFICRCLCPPPPIGIMLQKEKYIDKLMSPLIVIFLYSYGWVYNKHRPMAWELFCFCDDNVDKKWNIEIYKCSLKNVFCRLMYVCILTVMLLSWQLNPHVDSCNSCWQFCFNGERCVLMLTAVPSCWYLMTICKSTPLPLILILYSHIDNNAPMLTSVTSCVHTCPHVE